MKGQAAIEFLMTYGWAILVLAVAIGAIALSGVFSPTTFGREYCIAPPQLECLSTYANGDVFRVKVVNNFGFKILLTSVNGKVGGTQVEKRLGMELPQGATTTISFPTNLPQGTFVPFSLSFTYVPCAKEVNEGCMELEGLKYSIEVKGRVYVNPAS